MRKKVDLAIKLMRKKSSVTGNRTLVSRVTGGDTSHYTMTDDLLLEGILCYTTINNNYR